MYRIIGGWDWNIAGKIIIKRVGIYWGAPKIQAIYTWISFFHKTNTSYEILKSSTYSKHVGLKNFEN